MFSKLSMIIFIFILIIIYDHLLIRAIETETTKSK